MATADSKRPVSDEPLTRKACARTFGATQEVAVAPERLRQPAAQILIPTFGYGMNFRHGLGVHRRTWQQMTDQAASAVPHQASDDMQTLVADDVPHQASDVVQILVADDVPIQASDVVQMCNNCKCRPVAREVKCGFIDWCDRCDLSLFSTWQYESKCDAQRFPYPPINPVVYNDGVCPCGYFAIRNRPLARPGQENLLPMHLLVTIPVTAKSHISVCLICDALFKHHRHAVTHMRRHHKHYHDHH